MDLYVDDLNEAAKPLAQVVLGVEGIPEPQVPDAGVSSGPIAATVAALAGAASTVATSGAIAADMVQASANDYADADQSNGRLLASRAAALDRLGAPADFVGPVTQLPVNGGGR